MSLLWVMDRFWFLWFTSMYFCLIIIQFPRGVSSWSIVRRNLSLPRSTRTSTTTTRRTIQRHHSNAAFHSYTNYCSMPSSTGGRTFGSSSSMVLHAEKSTTTTEAISSSSSMEPPPTSSHSGTEEESMATNPEEGEESSPLPKTIVKVPKKFNPHPFPYHTEMDLRVHSLTNLGMGVCRTPYPQMAEEEEEEEERVGGGDDDDDTQMKNDGTREWVVFVPNVIPDELVRVRIYRNHASYSDADLVKVLEASPHRVPLPVCSLSDVCGGCQYQHMDISAQRQWKTQQVQELSERIGQQKTPDSFVVQPTVGTDEIYGYRSKITPHFDRPYKSERPNNDNNSDNKDSFISFEVREIGFKVKSSRRLVDVDCCPIATPAINRRLKDYREEIRQKAQSGELFQRKKKPKGATLLLRENEQDDGNIVVTTDPNQYVTTVVEGLRFRYKAGNFFQNNPYMLPVMVQHIVHHATLPSMTSDKNHDDNKMTHLIDCYCGSGLFCLSAAAHMDTCVGIELNDKAVEEARDNASLNNIENCHFVAASAEAIFEQEPTNNNKDDDKDDNDESLDVVVRVQDFPRSQTVVVCDPPRKGCSPEFLEQLFCFGPKRVLYMSCDPSTQARDAKIIVENGYRITCVQPLDLFPQTRHIECLMVFEKTTTTTLVT